MLQKKNRGMGKTVDTVVGNNTRITGSFFATGAVRIDGTVQSENGSYEDIEISTSEELIVGEKGEIYANTRGKKIIVAGKVFGTLECSECLELLSTGQVIGTVKTKRIYVESGAVFEGYCSMSETGDSTREEIEEVEEQSAVPEEDTSGHEQYEPVEEVLNREERLESDAAYTTDTEIKIDIEIENEIFAKEVEEAEEAEEAKEEEESAVRGEQSKEGEELEAQETPSLYSGEGDLVQEGENHREQEIELESSAGEEQKNEDPVQEIKLQEEKHLQEEQKRSNFVQEYKPEDSKSELEIEEKETEDTNGNPDIDHDETKKLFLAEFQFNGDLEIEKCPNGKVPVKSKYRPKKKFSEAYFKKSECKECELKYNCLVREHKKDMVLRIPKQFIRQVQKPLS